MKRTGYVSIIILLTISLILVLCMSIIFSGILQTSIASSSQKNIQLKMIGISKINRLIYHRDYLMKYIYPYLLKECKNDFIKDEYVVVLDDEAFKESNKDKIKIRFEDNKNRKYMTIETENVYEGLSNTIIYNGPAINHIFEKGYAYIGDYTVDIPKEELSQILNIIGKEIDEYTNNLPKNFSKICTDSKILNINYYDNNKVSTNYNDIKLETRNIFISLRQKFNRDTAIVIGSNDNDELIKLSGILYVEGDLIINQEFEFNGIIIINQGEIMINTNTKPLIKGIIVHDGIIEDMERLNLIYHKDNIYYYGLHLPGFMDPKLEVLKIY